MPGRAHFPAGCRIRRIKSPWRAHTPTSYASETTFRTPPRATDRVVAAHAGRLTFKYHAALKGFAGEFSDSAIAALGRDPAVLSIEPDQIVHAVGTQPNPPSWGLDRIDQRALPLDQSYTYNAIGTGVTVYIIDTGIWFTHVDFGGRAVKGEDEITPGGSALDCFGHGTHVAGTVGGSSYGVAKNVSLVAVRVLDCTGHGTTSTVIAGVDFVTAQKQAHPSTPMVANMSLAGGYSQAENDAVTNSIAAGVTYAIAAGNNTDNACNYSPSSTPNAIVVGATTSTDAMASYSNFGTCVKIFAPGTGITSDWYGSNTATRVDTGTSMAAPHVAGTAALYLERNPTATPAALATALTSNATLNTITGIGPNSPNLLLYTGFVPPPPLDAYITGDTATSIYMAHPSGGVPSYTYLWEWCASDCGGDALRAPAGVSAGGVQPKTVEHGWHDVGYYTESICWVMSGSTLRLTVTDAASSQVIAYYTVPVLEHVCGGP